MKSSLKFSVIIANFNGIKYINDCLSSVVKTDYKNYEIIIVEDGSNDGSLKVIEKFQKKYQLKVFQNEKNLGLVESRNRAIGKADGEILVFLDNDTQVDKNWLRGLDEIFKNQEIGAAQCKIFDYHKRDILQEAGMKLVPFTGFGTPVGRGQRDRGQFDHKEGIISLGAALAVRKKIAETIGGFDNKLFHYTDDLDFSWRVWIAGHKIVLAPKAIVYHYTKEHPADFHLYFHLSKNSLRMIMKNYQGLNVLKYLPISILINLIGGLVVLIRERTLDGIIGVVSGLTWNIIFLSDTLNTRIQLDKIRRLDDKHIFSQVMLTSSIFEIYNLYFRTAKANRALKDEKKLPVN